jgi:selenide,water dikinase
VSLRIDSRRVPLLEGALDCVRGGFIPGGLTANREFAECVVGYEGDVPAEVKTLLFDPQTAGGLLLSVAGEDADTLLAALRAADVPAVDIGEVLPKDKPLIKVA